jgi:hypothetical protein
MAPSVVSSKDVDPPVRTQGPKNELIFLLLLLLLRVALQRVVVQQLLNQVDMSEHHAPAAIAPQPEAVERVALAVALTIQHVKVLVVLAADHLAACEAADRDDHVGRVRASTPPPVRARADQGRSGRARHVRVGACTCRRGYLCAAEDVSRPRHE